MIPETTVITSRCCCIFSLQVSSSLSLSRWLDYHVKGPLFGCEDTVFGHFCDPVFCHFQVHLEVCALSPVLVLVDVSWQGHDSVFARYMWSKCSADVYLGWAAVTVVDL